MKSMRIQNESASQFPGKQRSYQDIVSYLDSHWNLQITGEAKKEQLRKLATALELSQSKQDAIMVCGTNGKSLTAHFTTRLLKSEGLVVGSLFSPHTLTYNERIVLNGEQINNRSFTELGSKVLDIAAEKGLTLGSDVVLTAIAQLYFAAQDVDVLVIENESSRAHDPATLCNTKVVVVTRVTAEDVNCTETAQEELINELKEIIKPGMHVVSGDQLKSHLLHIEKITLENSGVWEMPIRKVAPLAYPFEQIHGRCAALAERAAMLYMNTWGTENTTVVTDSILVKQKGKRGRPTLEAKQQEKLNPKKTVEQFWKETINELPSRFQLLDKEAPSVLLDSADNLDALENVLLGTRLLHYKRPIEGLTIIMSAEAQSFVSEDFVRSIRYFFKKTPGQIFLCPLESSVNPWQQGPSWDTNALVNELTNKKVKATAFKSFATAFETAKASVDPKLGLIVIVGSASIVSNYWQNRNIKKLG
ncbi:MAG: Tetrahydrofolate synthase [candidate division TM6 bacterium GW2011_GWF2_43_17]|nr:MAG: Tetrahydrofolate synthase [candidate division TM6 bacterium GW2011_GWF2_43_17]HAU30036.1 hypothetical protein [Candidatus Dependentiae bacterium]